MTRHSITLSFGPHRLASVGNSYHRVRTSRVIRTSTRNSTREVRTSIFVLPHAGFGRASCQSPLPVIIIVTFPITYAMLTARISSILSRTVRSLTGDMAHYLAVLCCVVYTDFRPEQSLASPHTDHLARKPLSLLPFAATDGNRAHRSCGLPIFIDPSDADPILCFSEIVKR